MKMGLNVNNFIAATNINDTIPRYFKTGKYTPKKTIRTISNAMDVSDPNNFPRIEHIFDNNFQALKNKIRAESKDAVKFIYDEFGIDLKERELMSKFRGHISND